MFINTSLNEILEILRDNDNFSISMEDELTFCIAIRDVIEMLYKNDEDKRLIDLYRRNEETWVDIYGYNSRYQVSNKWNVRQIKGDGKAKKLPIKLNKFGHKFVILDNNFEMVFVLVDNAFHNNINNARNYNKGSITITDEEILEIHASHGIEINEDYRQRYCENVRAIFEKIDRDIDDYDEKMSNKKYKRRMSSRDVDDIPPIVGDVKKNVPIPHVEIYLYDENYNLIKEFENKKQCGKWMKDNGYCDFVTLMMKKLNPKDKESIIDKGILYKGYYFYSYELLE